MAWVTPPAQRGEHLEEFNVARFADLRELYSHFGSRGITPLTILQSYKQGVRVWGEHGMDALWSAATVKLVGAGLDDARLAEDSRALPRGTALLLATGCRPAIIDLAPWYDSPTRSRVAAQLTRAETELTRRAAADSSR